jgi:peptidyl-tRNA hydrolase
MSVVNASSAAAASVGFAPEEMDFSLSTRQARLKWVVIVNADLPPGRAANAAVCAAAPTVAAVPGLLGSEVADAEGAVHPGLPWVGCSVLAADSAALRDLRAKAVSRADTFVADVPAAAQSTRVYGDFIAAVGKTQPEDMDYCAVSIVGPRTRVDKIVGKLPLMP